MMLVVDYPLELMKRTTFLMNFKKILILFFNFILFKRFWIFQSQRGEWIGRPVDESVSVRQHKFVGGFDVDGFDDIDQYVVHVFPGQQRQQHDGRLDGGRRFGPHAELRRCPAAATSQFIAGLWWTEIDADGARQRWRWQHGLDVASAFVAAESAGPAAGRPFGPLAPAHSAAAFVPPPGTREQRRHAGNTGQGPLLRLPGQVHVRSVQPVAQRQSGSGSLAGRRRLRPRLGYNG